ncbi:3-methyladenine DNA glycosylase AlkD [Pilibacter termitis]|uniref:3-methyladenine DNA glycosylase AlkD n=1 Tax=Pilibacter termitis TaxID=263852 RepID=A0A1T4Q5J4_9ENTE|nr:DNA alkylation repair protein [Pilibacter termitis]SJZ99055.1 3-methyladenine DNA glycosylase AlkD [Pilibacter termitis]
MKKIKFIGNSTVASEQERYMKHHFKFVGVKKPEQMAQSKEILSESKKIPLSELLEEIDYYYNQEEREYQYLAIQLALKNVKRLDKQAIFSLVPYISQKSWWDSVDFWRMVFGDYVATHPETLEKFATLFKEDQNFWVRRIGINLQLKFKEKTNTTLLETAILRDLSTDEFFIQKAIGWSLREFSKTNPKWVKNFIATHSLSALAKREGSKYL